MLCHASHGARRTHARTLRIRIRVGLRQRPRVRAEPRQQCAAALLEVLLAAPVPPRQRRQGRCVTLLPCRGGGLLLLLLLGLPLALRLWDIGFVSSFRFVSQAHSSHSHRIVAQQPTTKCRACARRFYTEVCLCCAVRDVSPGCHRSRLSLAAEARNRLRWRFLCATTHIPSSRSACRTRFR